MKRVSFSLFPGQAEEYKALVDSSLQSRILRNYILNDYKLPRELSIINQGEKKGLKPVPFRFDVYSDKKLNELVQNVREAGYTANRSSLMRHIMEQLISKLKHQNGAKEREIRHSSFYFEKGIKEVLDHYVLFRDRNATIERFIIEEYIPRVRDLMLYEKPEEPESMRISMSADAFKKLDRYVDEIDVKGLTRTALMRDVVDQLIEKVSNSTSRNLIAEMKLQNAIQEYERTFGSSVLRERLSIYGSRENKEK
jgi:hypothetical protein